jgi:hypothetical protein
MWKTRASVVKTRQGARYASTSGVSIRILTDLLQILRLFEASVTLLELFASACV